MRHHALAVVLVFALAAVAPLYAQRNMLSLPDVSGAAGSEIVIPLSGTLRDDISGMTATLFFDPAVIRVTGVQLTSATAAFSLQTRFSAGELRIAMAAATPLDSSAALLEISVRLIGAPGTASILDLAQVSLDEGARTVGTRDGIVRVLRQFKIPG